ncbi:MAG TPA: hypothetical protein PLV45_13790, partial [bacterium]|nr:hypothetical protein [bacterium]
MTKKLYVLLLPVLIVFVATGTTANQLIKHDAPLVQVTDSQWDTIDINVRIDGIDSREVKTRGGTFTRLMVDRDAFKGDIG